MLELKLLGSPQILLHGQPVIGLSAAKSQALLFYLALSGRPQSRLALAGLLWPDKSDSEALANLRQALYHLRNALPAYLESTRLTLAFKADLPCQMDVLLFEEEAAPQAFAESAIPVYQTAIERYRGEFLAGFYVEEAEPFDAWAVVTRERLHHLATQTLQQLATHFVDRRETGPGLRYTNHWLALEPWREKAHRHKLRLLVWDGQPQAALAHYERCRQLLLAELGAEPEAETIALYEQIRNGQGESGPTHQAIAPSGEPHTAEPDQTLALRFGREDALFATRIPIPPLPASPRVATPPHNLPTYRTPLIGREAEVAQLCRLLLDPTRRLVTLVGPSGVGKTQVALAVAQALLEGGPPLSALANGTPPNDAIGPGPTAGFPDGVWFVPLAGVTMAWSAPEAALAGAILQALAVTPTGSRAPQQQLVAYVQHKQLLLVLDQVDPLSATTDWLAWLLQSAPQLSLFITTPRPLHLKSEVVMSLAGLPTPAHDDDPQALAYDSLRLLRERAGRAWPAFGLTGESLRSIVQLCRQLDGLPLSLALVAGWASQWTYTQIAQAIAETLTLPALSVSGQPERPPSSQAVCEFVWQRLMPAEQAALAGATVFHGSFSRAAFLAVTKARLTDLVSLHDRALLQQDGVGRYVMPDLVRTFASHKLQTLLGGGDEVRNRHAEYYANFLQACEQELKTANQRQAVAAIQLDLDNVLALWQRAILRHHLPTVEKVQESLWYFYTLQGRSWEGEALFAGAATALLTLDAGADPQASRHALALGQVLSWQGWFQMQMGRSAEALEALQQSLARFAQASAHMHRTMTYAHLAAAQIHLGWDEPAQALAQITQGLTHAQECGDPWGSAYATLLRGPLTLAVRQYTRVAAHYAASLASLRTIGDPRLLAECLVLCADTAIHLGEYNQAEAYLQESRPLIQDSGGTVGLLCTDLAHSELYLARGQYGEAHALGVACLHRCAASADERSLTAVLHLLGRIAYAGQAYAEAQSYLQESLRVAEQIGSPSAVVRALTALGAVHEQLGAGQQAKTMLQKSYQLAQQIPQRADLLATALGGLATVNVALDANAEAAAMYQQALTSAMQTASPPLILDLLVGLAALHLKTGNAPPVRIADWLTLAAHQPTSTQATKTRATQLLAEVKATAMITGPAAVQASLARHGDEQEWPAWLIPILAITRQNSPSTD